MIAKHKDNAISLAGDTLLKMQLGIYMPHQLAGAWEVLQHLLEDHAEGRSQ
jgi:hypothetical protein